MNSRLNMFSCIIQFIRARGADIKNNRSLFRTSNLLNQTLTGFIIYYVMKYFAYFSQEKKKNYDYNNFIWLFFAYVLTILLMSRLVVLQHFFHWSEEETPWSVKIANFRLIILFIFFRKENEFTTWSL